MTVKTSASKRPGRPKRASPKQDDSGLTAQTIFAKALALIDKRGVADFNIRDLASALGVSPAAIYWHVPNRSALLSGAHNLAFADVATHLAGTTWQERLRSLFHAFRKVLQRHPNFAPFVVSEMAYNASFDASLLNEVVSILEDAGFAGAAIVDAFNVVIAAMCGFPTLEMAAPAPEEDWAKRCQQQLDSVDRKRYPRLSRHLDALTNNAFILRWSSGASRPFNRSFDYWIDVTIAGLEAIRGR